MKEFKTVQSFKQFKSTNAGALKPYSFDYRLQPL